MNIKLSPNTKIWFFNSELGYVGYNLVKHLEWSRNITPERRKVLEEKGYVTVDSSPDRFIETFVVMKAIPKKDRELFLTLRDETALTRIKEFLENKY